MKINNLNFKNSEFWNKLLVEQQKIANIPIANFFIEDPDRFNNFSLKLSELNLLFDFSKQHLNSSILNTLYGAAKHCQLTKRIQDLFAGKKVNLTEYRSVGHSMLRDLDPGTDIKINLAKMHAIAESIYSSGIKDVLCLGIGGSYLGPKMICQALDHYTNSLAKDINLHFIANYDQQTLEKILIKLDPKQTVTIISSKSFTTAETINNAKLVKHWFAEQLFGKNYLAKIFAVTSNINKAIEFGIIPENILAFNDNIGGRYSVWSVVGLPVVIKLGIDNFKKFLKGGYLLDQHFQHAEFRNNIPITMGLIGIWNINFMQYRSLAIIPYLDSLESLPEYLQQLVMESNGKSLDLYNNKIHHDTSEIIFGGVGCNVQHSFMQMLHQGSQVIPVDFLVAADRQKFLFANCLAQSQALMQGTNHVTTDHKLLPNAIESFKYCAGSRPSSTILFKQITPEILGAIIAIYEHKVFVQSVMWGINPFDQWGVELGKTLANHILERLNLDLKVSQQMEQLSFLDQADPDLVQSSTTGLIREYLHLNYDL